MKLLENKIALITGSARGIGYEIAKKFGENGAKVVITDISLEAVNSAVNSLKEIGIDAVGYELNVTDFEAVKATIEKILKDLGDLDILVNNAGITKDNLILRMSKEDWDAVINVNLTGSFHMIKALYKHFMKKRSGKIVNIASIIGLMGNAGQANYSASKAGLIALTKTTAKELASRGINVNAVAPGFIKTAMTDKLPEKERNAMIEQIPIKRLGQPEDVANAVLFLSSNLADYITGQVIVVDGGMVMY